MRLIVAAVDIAAAGGINIFIFISEPQLLHLSPSNPAAVAPGHAHDRAHRTRLRGGHEEAVAERRDDESGRDAEAAGTGKPRGVEVEE